MTLIEGRRPSSGDPTGDVASCYHAIYDHLAVTDPVAPSDAIICFGSRDPVVPATAAELYAAGIAPVLLVTGGATLHPGRCEADVMADELTKVGVPPDRVLVETRSTHTGENVRFGMAMLQRAVGPVAEVVSVAWPFAARRCRATLAHHHPEVTVRSVPSFDRPGERTPLTPASARWAVEQFDRLVRYQAKGWIAGPAASGELLAAAEVVRRALG